MSHYLVYWQTYWDEINEGYRPGPQYNSDSEMMYKTVKRGDWLWVVILGRSHTENEWRLIERINVANVYPNPARPNWRKWHFEGNKKRSQVFSFDSQPDLTALLWLLTFASGKRIKYKGKKIGQTLQSHGFRLISERDVILFEEYARTLKFNDKDNLYNKGQTTATQLEF